MTSNDILGETLEEQYRLACEQRGIHPHLIIHQFRECIVRFDPFIEDRLHLECICQTISKKESPYKVTIEQTKPAKARETTEDKYNYSQSLSRVMEALEVMLGVSKTLASLNIINIKLRKQDISALAHGLSDTSTLENLKLKGCDLTSALIEDLCWGIKNSPSVVWLNLTNNNINAKGCEMISEVIKYQCVQRQNVIWKDTLRTQIPLLDDIRGLRRITLNNNSALQDDGVAYLQHALLEDIWIKALDLQNCGITSKGGKDIIQLLEKNQVLEVVDLRDNSSIDMNITDSIDSILFTRSECEFKKLDLASDKNNSSSKDNNYHMQNCRRIKRKNCKINNVRSSAYRIGRLRQPKQEPCIGIPWRVENRIYQRRRGVSIRSHYVGPLSDYDVCACDCKDPEFKEWINVPKPHSKSICSTPESRDKLLELKVKLKKERQRRKKAEYTLKKIKLEMKDKQLIDGTTIANIERCFQQCRLFIDKFTEH